MHGNREEELRLLAQIGEEKIRRLKKTYDLSESELALLLRLNKDSGHFYKSDSAAR